MREAFSQHFVTDPDRRAKLWENCLFVFDTNVLTGIYRRSEEARDAQYKLMGELGDRLWVPHRVIYEFLDNRAKIVHDQAQLYAASINELQGMLANFEVATKHPFLSAEIYSEFKLVSEKVLSDLVASREFHEGRITNDDVKLRLADILDGKVGPPFTEERLVEIVKDGEARYEQNIPPGFEDRGKHKGSSITEEIRKRYGDLIIWYQIIEKATLEGRPVILITGDQKADWWAEQSGKKLGPHPILIEEFKKLSGQDFYLYSYHGFLDYANQYLDQKTSEAVIEEVRESALLDAANLVDDAEVSVDAPIVIGPGALKKWREFLKSDFGFVSNPRYLALHQEMELVRQKIHTCNVEMALKKKLLGEAVLNKGELPHVYSQLVAELAEINSQHSMYMSQLSYLQQEVLRYQEEGPD